MSKQQRFTGAKRRYTTKKSIKFMDLAAKTLITLGGMGTILAVTGVFVFLTSVVIPLFAPAELTPAQKVTELNEQTRNAPLLITDEFLLSAWTLEDDGSAVRSFELSDGATLKDVDLFDGEVPQAYGYDSISQVLIAAFADGRIELKKISFETTFLLDEGTRQCHRLRRGYCSANPHWSAAQFESGN